MDKEPTQEQVKEFWEWCRVPNVEFGTFDAFGNHLGILPIDLNNLFKYAVPKLIDKYGAIEFILPQSDIPTWDCNIKESPKIDNFVGSSKDPALALFWALWKVKEGTDG